MGMIFQMIDGTAFDNFNPMVWRFGEKNLRNGVYMAVTDAPAALQFNISDLSTKGEILLEDLLGYSFKAMFV